MTAGTSLACGRLGVGLIWAPEFEPLFTDAVAAPAVVELEPQTLWSVGRREGRWCYRQDEQELRRIAALSQHRLLHGVGQPFATVSPDPIEHLAVLRHTVEVLDPRWVSEHLSFNRARIGGSCQELGFLLPPRQTEATVRVAAANIDRYRRALDRPVAFETGVNYLTTECDVLDDGAFFTRVAEVADAGILLDLHNIWCNHVNGRADFDATLAAIDFGRVWEVHLAGGDEFEGTWLDAHSAAVPPALLDRLPELMPRLTGLRALTYELMPMHAERIGLDAVAAQLETLRALWNELPAAVAAVPMSQPAATEAPDAADLASVGAWERSVADALCDNADGGPLAGELCRCTEIGIYRHLIATARFSAVTRGAERTVTLLLAALGGTETRHLLAAFTQGSPPHSYRTVEALHFLDFLTARINADPRGRLARVPYLREVAEWERAVLGVHLGGRAKTVTWSADPVQILGCIDQGRVPSRLPAAPQRITVTSGTP